LGSTSARTRSNGWLDKRGAIVLQQKVTRHQLERRLSNIPRCLIGMETCSGTHFLGRQLTALGHDVRLIPAQYVKPFLKGHKTDYRDAEAIAEAVQRPTLQFVSIKTPEQMDLLALHRVRSRLVKQRTGDLALLRPASRLVGCLLIEAKLAQCQSSLQNRVRPKPVIRVAQWSYL
jgi:transposase